MFLLPEDGRGDIFENCFFRVKYRILGQKGDLPAVPGDDGPMVRLPLPGNDGQDGGFTGPVYTDHSDPVVIFDAGGHVAKDRLIPQGDPDMFQS